MSLASGRDSLRDGASRGHAGPGKGAEEPLEAQPFNERSSAAGPAEPEQAGVQEGVQGLDFEDKELLADTISALRAAGIATDEKQL